MTNDNKELKNNAPCEEKQEARKLTDEELAKVTGGCSHDVYDSMPAPGPDDIPWTERPHLST